MTEPLSLMEFVHALLADHGLRGRFAADPRATLDAYGLGDLGQADVHDALDLVQDNEITDYSTESTHPQPAWDAEAFGHGGSGPFAGGPGSWAGEIGEDPGDGSSTDWPDRHGDFTDHAGPEAAWGDDGFGTGLDGDEAPSPDTPPDLHHHG